MSRGELTQISQRIADIVADRLERADALQREIDRLESIEGELQKLRDGASALATALDSTVLEPTISDALQQALGSRRFLESKAMLGRVLARLRVALRRMSRDTINIGVTGQARMGKSTILQAITGLGEDQIPTGDNIPVTAVGSRISYVAPETEPSAEIAFYPYHDFRDTVLVPFFDTLQIPGGAPRTKESFSTYELPDVTPPRHLEATLVRLKRVLAHRRDYVDLLDAPDAIINDINELRPYVAYPRHGEDTPERYHAVASVVVKCTFPHGVERIVVMDLPGLGEVDPKAENHHIQHLQDEVDMVLFVKRPTPATSYWSEHDANVTRLIEHAKGDVADVDDFCLMVVNTNTDDQAEVKRRQPLLRDVNEKSGFSRSQVLECDGRKPNSVISGVVKPALEHLVSRLPDMDRQVAQAALVQAETVQADTHSITADLRRVVAVALRALGSAERDTDKRAAALHEELAVKLLEILRKIDPGQTASSPPQARADAKKEKKEPEPPPPPKPTVKPEYAEAIERAASRARGMFDSEDALNFREQFEGKYALDGTPGVYLKNAYNTARVAIDRAICTYDDFLAKEVRSAWDAFFQVLSDSSLGPLLSQGGAQEASGLTIFLERLQRIENQCPEITSAVREFLKLSIRCESHFLHLYDDDLFKLNVMVRGLYGSYDGQQLGDFPNAKEGPDWAYEEFFERAKAVVETVKKELTQAAPVPPRVIHACAFRFFDRFCRPESAREEFALFCQEYRELIWPQLAKPAQVRRDLESIRNCCDRIIEATRVGEGRPLAVA